MYAPTMFLSTVVLGATTVWTADAQQSLGHLQTIYGWTSKVVFDGAYVIFGLVDTDSYLLTFDSGTRRSDVDTWNNNVDSATRARAIVTPFSGPISGMSALDGFLYVVESNAPKRICKFDYLSGAQIWRVPHSTSSHDDSITDLVVSSNGVYTSSVDGTIKQWNITNGDLVAVVQTAIGPNGFFSPIRNLFLNRITNRLYASFGRYVKSDGVGRATLLPSGDFEGLSAEDVFYTAGGSLGDWKTSLRIWLYKASYFTTIPALSGSYVLWFGTSADPSYKLFVKQTISLIPGHSYRIRFWFARHGTRTLYKTHAFTLCGKRVLVPLLNPSKQTYHQATSPFIQATGKLCEIELSAQECSPNEFCTTIVDYVELVLAQRTDNTDNMEVVSVADGNFEGITATDTNITFTGTVGSWTKTGGGGTVGIARVGSVNCYNSPAVGGSYVLWMETVAGSDTTVSQTVSLVRGATYTIRWHFAMRHIVGGKKLDLVSSALNVSLCGVVVASNFTAPSLLFEEVSSSTFTPVGTATVACALSFTILRGASTLRSLLIDDAKLVRIYNPNLVPSGSFEGLTTTVTSWVVYPGALGDWMSNGHSSGRTAIVRLPSTDCDNTWTLANPYVLWIQSSTSSPPVTVSVTITSLVPGSTYRVRWNSALRKLGTTVYDSPSLAVSIFGVTVASNRIPVFTNFTADQSSEFIAGSTTTVLRLAVSVVSSTLHMLIDDVEIVLVRAADLIGDVPLVKEYSIGTTSLTHLRDYTLPESWLSTLVTGVIVDFAALVTTSDRLYTGMSQSVVNNTCHVLEYNTVDGSYVDVRTMTCNQGSVHSLAISDDQLYIGHNGPIFQISLTNSFLMRTLAWSGNFNITGMAANNMYIIGASYKGLARKYRVLSVTITTTTTTTRTTTTSTTTQMSTTSTTSSTTTSSTAPFAATTTEIGQDGGKSGPVASGLPDISVLIIAGSGAVLVLALGVIFLVFVVFRRNNPGRGLQQTFTHTAPTRNAHRGMRGGQPLMRPLQEEYMPNYPPQMYLDGSGIPMRQFRR